MSFVKLILSAEVSILIFLNPITLGATNFADYMPLTLGSYWTYQNDDDPTDIYTDSVFEELIFNGNPAVKLGTDDCNYNIGYNDGLALHIYASVEDCILDDFNDVSIGEFQDGFFFNLVDPTNFALFRIWDNLDPTLKSVYGIDPALDNLVLWVAYDSNFPSNSQNSIVESNLGVSIPDYAVTELAWSAPNIGEIVRLDIDAKTGNIGQRDELVDYNIVPLVSQGTRKAMPFIPLLLLDN